MTNEKLPHEVFVECPHCGEQHNQEQLEHYVEQVGETPCCGKSIDLVETSVEEM